MNVSRNLLIFGYPVFFERPFRSIQNGVRHRDEVLVHTWLGQRVPPDPWKVSKRKVNLG